MVLLTMPELHRVSVVRGSTVEEIICQAHGHLPFCSFLLGLGGPGDYCRKEL